MSNRGPEWVKSAVFYEIYPQTFYDSNGDGIGDLQGVIQKLDYIERLGANVIWLNPCFVSPFKDAGYDVADYYRVAPRYGTNDDLVELFDKARERGMRVLLDLVPGHTSIEHEWFKKSSHPEPNEYSNWYIWTNSVWDDGGESFAPRMIQGYSDRDGCYLTNYFYHQAALNFGFYEPDPNKPWQLSCDHPDVQRVWKEFHKIIRYWLDKGASGFRVDMAGSIIRNDPDNKGCKQFWGSVREMLDNEYPDAFLVAEWSCPMNAIDAGFHSDFHHWFAGHYDLFRGDERRSGPGGRGTGNTFFDRKGKGDVTQFLEGYMEHYEKVKGRGYASIPVGNHDLPRINIDHNQNELEMITAFLMTFPGTPFLYYGDEIGMRHQFGMPNREGAYQPRVGARTPMQWSGEKNAGFSEAPSEALYLPVDVAADAPTVAAQEADQTSLLNVTRQLIQMRRAHRALDADADFQVVYAEKNSCPFIFQRKKGGETVWVGFNPAEDSQSVKLDAALPEKPSNTFDCLAGCRPDMTAEGLSMPGQTYFVLQL